MDMESQPCFSYSFHGYALSQLSTIDMTVRNGSIFEPSTEVKQCPNRDASQKHVVPEEDLKLTLSLSCLPMTFGKGGNASSHVLHPDIAEKTYSSVDLELSLTCSGPVMESTHLTSPQGSVSGGKSFSSGTSRFWHDECSNESRSVVSETDIIHSHSGSMDDTIRSSLRSSGASGMEVDLGFGGSSDCLLDDSLHSSGAVARMFRVPLIDEGSTSGKSPKLGAYSNLGDVRRREFKMPNDYERAEAGRGFDSPQPKTVDARDRPSKLCKREGCRKGARGASGLCIAHGGGRRCEKPDCNKGAEGRTKFCKAHGGGKRCDHLGCIKSAEGKTNFCIAHGGGRRCSQEGCTKAARGKSGLCIRHGGGKRCREEGCTKSAEGLSGLCISHGGGRRCEFPNCGKGAQGSTRLCKAHGGGRRCEYEGCTKGAEGSTRLCKAHGGGKRCTFGGGGICTKSVHGGTSFCVAHGGGKRCKIPGCTTSARGKTDFCVKHGGGKRCKFEKCNKSAQGSTDFCKAHGGGKKADRSGHGLSNLQGLNPDETPKLVQDGQAHYDHHTSVFPASNSADVSPQADVISFSGFGNQVSWTSPQPSNNCVTPPWQFPSDFASAYKNLADIPSSSNLEERVHGGSHIMALLSSGVVRFGQ